MEAKDEAERDERLTRFLLGNLPSEEHARIEERVFVDDDLDAALQSATDDLIRAYLSGALSTDDRSRFEAHFLVSPLHRERLRFLRDLAVAAERVRGRTAPPRARGFGMWWRVAAAFLLIVGAWVLSLRPQPPQDERAGGQPTPTPTAIASASRPLPSANTPSESPRLHSADETRVVRLRRGAAPSSPVRVDLSSETQTLRLEVPVELGAHPTFKASIRAKGGAVVWAADDLVPSGREEPLVLVVPAKVLDRGDYLVTVEGEPLRLTSPAPSRAPLLFPLRIGRLPRTPPPAR